jgi:Flp pilus assembly protein TadD
MLLEQGHFGEAEREFLESIRLNPNSTSAHFGLARALQKQKRFAESIAPLQ